MALNEGTVLQVFSGDSQAFLAANEARQRKSLFHGVGGGWFG